MIPRQRTKLIFAAAATCMLIALGEVGFWGISRFLPFGFDYVPPTRQEFDAYLEHAKATNGLTAGWLPDPNEITPEGFRHSPAGDSFDEPCVSLYGDSFTWGDDVEDADTWGNVLSGLLGCRIANYGVNGYGTDQAVLRFKDNTNDQAPIVVLAHWAENVVRNVNQDRTMIYGTGIVLKPRFILSEEGSLELVPRPVLLPADYDAYVSSPRDFLKDEYFIPDTGALSKTRLRFPYVINIPKYFLYKRMFLGITSLWLNTPSWYAEFYDIQHPSSALRITTKILIQFYHEAQAQGRTPIVLVLPSIRDVNDYQRQQVWVYQSLIDALVSDGIMAVNVGHEFIHRIRDEDFCVYLCTAKQRRSGHYTVKGNQLLAEIVRDVLINRGYFEMDTVVVK